MRLGATIACVGAANSLADPKRLLASLPAALHEAGTSVVIALAVFPQLVESAQRVRRARSLRPDHGRVRGLRGIVVPVLEDAFDRSLALAASMEARGYGRVRDGAPGARHRTGALLVAALALTCIGMYATLDATLPRWTGAPALVLGVALAALGARSAGRRVVRTRYRPQRWSLADALVAASGAGAAVLVILAGHADPQAIHPEPSLDALPPVTLLALGAVAAAALPAWSLPRPRSARVEARA
jgi:energy-coupling factor transport system permease protein